MSAGGTGGVGGAGGTVKRHRVLGFFAGLFFGLGVALLLAVLGVVAMNLIIVGAITAGFVVLGVVLTSVVPARPPRP